MNTVSQCVLIRDSEGVEQERSKQAVPGHPGECSQASPAATLQALDKTACSVSYRSYATL